MNPTALKTAPPTLTSNAIRRLDLIGDGGAGLLSLGKLMVPSPPCCEDDGTFETTVSTFRHVRLFWSIGSFPILEERAGP
jgi:hypothetical protein